jgi:hypothetical protein
MISIIKKTVEKFIKWNSFLIFYFLFIDWNISSSRNRVHCYKKYIHHHNTRFFQELNCQYNFIIIIIKIFMFDYFYMLTLIQEKRKKSMIYKLIIYETNFKSVDIIVKIKI